MAAEKFIVPMLVIILIGVPAQAFYILSGVPA